MQTIKSFPFSFFIFLLAILILGLVKPPNLRAQIEISPTKVSHYSFSTGKIHIPFAITSDKFGNVYISGMCVRNSPDIFVLKLNSDGDTLWTQILDSPEHLDDWATGICVGGDGSVYVCGYSWNIGTRWDCILIKLDEMGNLQWVKAFATVEDDYAFGIAIDKLENVIITGKTKAIGTGYDFLTLKYSSSGTLLWEKRYDGPVNGDDEAIAVKVDELGNVYVTGRSVGVSTGFDFVTLKYSPNGDDLWVERYDGDAKDFDEPVALALDKSRNVYVTGRSRGNNSNFDFLTIKYDNSGNQLWVARYDGGNQEIDEPNSLANDEEGNVIVVGRSYSSTTNFDFLTVKYSSGGNELWAKKFVGEGEDTDTMPPSFVGLVAADSLSPGDIRLDWAPAIDNQTRSDEITYEIFVGSSPDQFDFTNPMFSTTGGVTSIIATGFTPGNLYYFVVRAKDKAGNVDTNNVHRAPMKEPPMPSFDAGNITNDDVTEINLIASFLAQVGGPSTELKIKTAELQNRFEIIFNRLNISMDQDEIPLLFDVLQAMLISFKDYLLEANSQEALMLLPWVDAQIGLLGTTKIKLEDALKSWAIGYGALPSQVEDISIAVPEGLVNSIAEALEIPVDELKALILRIPPNERLTSFADKSTVVVNPKGIPYPQPSVPWWRRTLSGIKKVASKAVSKVGLPIKLGNLLLDYGYAIVDCYSKHFPDWTAIDDCLVNEHGLAKDVVKRIIDALLDP